MLCVRVVHSFYIDVLDRWFQTVCIYLLCVVCNLHQMWQWCVAGDMPQTAWRPHPAWSCRHTCFQLAWFSVWERSTVSILTFLTDGSRLFVFIYYAWFAAGITCDSDALLEAGRKLHEDPSMKLQGLYTHCGQAYTEMTPKQRKDDQKQLVSKLLGAAKKWVSFSAGVNPQYYVNGYWNCIRATDLWMQPLYVQAVIQPSYAHGCSVYLGIFFLASSVHIRKCLYMLLMWWIAWRQDKSVVL